MDISGNVLCKTRNLEKSNIIRFVLLYAVIAVSFFAIGPRAFSSEWVSSSDFHACIEIAGSFIAVIAIVLGGGVTALAFSLPLPRFIHPENIISRPVDFVSAVLFLAAFLLAIKRFVRVRDVFSGMLLACILGKLEDYWFVICKRVSRGQLQWAQNR